MATLYTVVLKFLYIATVKYFSAQTALYMYYKHITITATIITSFIQLSLLTFSIIQDVIITFQ